MTAAEAALALVLALRSDDPDEAGDAATALKAMGWSKARIQRARSRP